MLPEMKDGVVAEVFGKAVAVPRHFIEDAAMDLSEKSPALAMEYAGSGLEMLVSADQYAIIAFLRLGLFVPMCFSRLSVKECIPEIIVTDRTIHEFDAGNIDPTDVLERRIGNYSPALIMRLQQLHDLSVDDNVDPHILEPAYRYALKSFLLFDYASSAKYTLDPTKDLGLFDAAPLQSIPVIDKPLMLRLLFDYIVSPRTTLKEILDTIDAFSDPLNDFLAPQMESVNPGYTLASCLTYRAIFQTFRRENERMPNFTTAVLQDLGTERSRLGRTDGVKNLLTRVGAENPNLCKAIELLGRGGFDRNALNMGYMWTYMALSRQAYMNLYVS